MHKYVRTYIVANYYYFFYSMWARRWAMKPWLIWRKMMKSLEPAASSGCLMPKANGHNLFRTGSISKLFQCLKAVDITCCKPDAFRKHLFQTKLIVNVLSLLSTKTHLCSFMGLFFVKGRTKVLYQSTFYLVIMCPI